MPIIDQPRSLSLWLFVGSLVMAPLSDIRVIGHLSFCDLLLVAAVAAALVEYLLYKESVPILILYLLIAVLFTLRFLAALFNTGFEFWQPFIIVLVACSFTPLAVSIMRVRKLGEFNFLLLAWTLGGFLGVLFIIAYCNGLVPEYEDKYWTNGGRARGLTPHPNTAGLAAALTLPGLFFLLSYTKTFLPRAVLFVCIALTLKAIDYTGSRASFAVAIIFIMLWVGLSLLSLQRFGLITNKQVTGWTASIVLGGLVVALYLMWGGQIDLLSAVWERMFGQDPYVQHSNWTRGVLNEVAWEGFLSSPLLGQGYKWTSFHQDAVAHNMYLQYLHATGLLGFTAFMMMLLYPLVYPVRAFFYSTSLDVTRLNNCIIAAAAALLVLLFKRSGFADYESILIFCLPLILYLRRLYERGA